MAERRFYWLKFKDDFFTSKRIKKLRKLAGGDTLTIIYLKMQLKSIKTDGVLTFSGIERSFAEELALDLDESPEDVGLLLNYLISVGLIETSDNINFLLPYVVENTGSESASAERKRNQRKRLERDNVTDMSHISHTDVPKLSQVSHVEKEIEKDIEIDIDKEKEKRKRFVPPTVDDVRAYCQERQNNVDPERFVDFYSAKGWKIGKDSMKDWKACVRTWEKRDGNVGANGVKLADNKDHTLDDIL